MVFRFAPAYTAPMSFEKCMLITLLALYASFASAQTHSRNLTMAQDQIGDGQLIKLPIHTTIQIDDSLKITVTYFTHKRPYVGGATQASAYMTMSLGDESEQIHLSVRGREGFNEQRYDSLDWQNYHIQLKGFVYDEFIEILITKIK